jgi:hypothetical protein
VQPTGPAVPPAHQLVTSKLPNLATSSASGMSDCRENAARSKRARGQIGTRLALDPATCLLVEGDGAGKAAPGPAGGLQAGTHVGEACTPAVHHPLALLRSKQARLQPWKAAARVRGSRWPGPVGGPSVTP